MTIDELNLPPIDDTMRWVVERDSDLFVGRLFRIKLQRKKRFFGWETIARGHCPLDEGVGGIEHVAHGIIERFNQWNAAEDLEGIKYGNPEYRKK